MPDDPFARPVAHRGLHDRAEGIVENSASAFAAAIERGFGIECDLHLTADGEVVVFHDDDLERLTGRTGRLHTISAEQLCATPLLGSVAQDCPPRFTALLSQVAGMAPLVVELKRQPSAAAGRELAHKAVDLVREYRGPLVFKSFEPAILAAVRDAGYNGALGIVTYGYRAPEWNRTLSAPQRIVRRHLLHWPRTRFTFISCAHDALTLPAIRLFRPFGMKVMSWTVKDPATARYALEHADQIVFEGFDPDT